MPDIDKIRETDDFDFGVQLRKTVTDAYLRFAMRAIENHQQGKKQKGLSAGFQKDARLVVRAVELEMLDGTESDEWDVLYAIECAKAKDDNEAKAIWKAECLDNAARDWKTVKARVAKANGKPRAEKAKTLAEQVAIARKILEELLAQDTSDDGDCRYCGAHDYPVDSNGKRITTDDVSEAAEWDTDHSAKCPFTIVDRALVALPSELARRQEAKARAK